MSNAPQWGQFDGVIQWGSFGGVGAGPAAGTGRLQGWRVLATGFDGVFVWPNSGSGGVAETPPVVVTETRGRSGRRYRVIEDPDLLCAELEKEEKVVAKQKKQLTILVSKSPKLEGALYRQVEEKIHVLEAKIDDRMQRIAELMFAIQVALDEQDDDEEEVLLMS